MPSWPSGNKPVTTTTDADSDSISGARADINKTISNQIDIIDIFNIPSSPTDNHILVYNATTAKFDVEANPGGELVNDTTPQLGGDLDVNGHDILNSATSGKVEINDDLVIKTISAQSTNGTLQIGDDNNFKRVTLNDLSFNFDPLSSGYTFPFFFDAAGSGFEFRETVQVEKLEIKPTSGGAVEYALPTADGSANQVLATNGSGVLSFVAPTAGGQLTSDLDQNGNEIKDTSRNYQIIGNQASPSSVNYKSFNSTARVHGVVTVNEVTGPTNRVHSNPRLSLVTMDADVSGSANAGRIRANYIEGIVQTDGHSNTTSGFGRGASGAFFSGAIENNHASDASTFTQSNGVTVLTRAGGSQALTITNQTGVSVTANADSTPTVQNYVGYRYTAPIGTSANIGTSTHFSFKGEDANATLHNEGPAVLKGLAYPTSDGTNGQVIVTNGSGTLSFADNAGSFTGDLAGNHLRDSNDGIVSVREGTNAADLLQIYDGSGNGGTDSTGRIDLQAVSTNVLGNSIRSIVRGTTDFANFLFQGKLLDFFGIGSSIRFDSTTVSGSTPEIAFRTDSTTRLSVFGDKIQASQPTQLPNYTVAGLPTGLGSNGTGALAFVTNASAVTSGKCACFWDGSAWKLLHDPNTTVT